MMLKLALALGAITGAFSWPLARPRPIHPRSTQMHAVDKGSSGASAYETLKTCLEGDHSPAAEAIECDLGALEEAFKILDSEVIRAECSESQLNDVSELWCV